MTTRLARIQVKDFRGLQDFAVEIPDAGVVVEGRNQGGKSTLLDAMRALLGGREASGDDVRNGADRARLAGELTDGTEIERTIPRDGAQRLTVRRGGKSVAKPQEALDELLGGVAAFDPGKFLSADAREQSRMVGEAIPCTLTSAQLAAWGIDGKHDLSGHGLAALARVRASIEAARTEANADAKIRRADAEVAKREAAHVEGLHAPTVAEAEKAARDAVLALAGLHRRRDDAAKRSAQNEATRLRVAGLRARANEEVHCLVHVDSARVLELQSAAQDAESAVAQLRSALIAAEARAEEARCAHEELLDRGLAVAEAERDVARMRSEADALEAAVGGPLEAPTDAELVAAEAAKAEAEDGVALARAAEQAFAIRHGAAQKAECADLAEARAAGLQAQVDFLRDTAPAQIVQGGIAGVELTDKGVVVDGVPFAKLSTSRRMEIAVRVAILRSPKAGWVQVDNLEAFDPDHAAELIAHVHGAGRAFVGAIVSRSDLRVTPVGWAPPTASDDPSAADADTSLDDLFA